MFFSPAKADSQATSEKANPLAVLFFVALFFLCGADLFFATRVGGFNLRWGQVLLFICALISLWDLPGQYRSHSLSWRQHSALFKNWLPFFVIYGIAALLGASPGRSLLKLGWAIFNIGGAALLYLNPRWRRSLGSGTIWGVLAIAIVLWAQLILIYGFGAQGVLVPANLSFALIHQNLPLPTLGYAQFACDYLGIQILRPSAFYYVPSFAACALVFALGALILSLRKPSGFWRLLPVALVCSAAILTSARSGVLSLFLVFGYVVLASILKKQKSLPPLMLKSMALTLGLILLVFLLPNGRKYMDFFGGILNPFSISSRIHNPDSSEGGRFASILHALELWKEHPILGNGVSTDPGQSPGLGQLAENTWVEFPVESGLLGLLAFLWALYQTLRGAFKENTNQEVAILVSACLVSHFVVDLNFTATFPRLDYWLIFFFYVHLLTREKAIQQNS
jgi:hypothetical protein